MIIVLTKVVIALVIFFSGIVFILYTNRFAKELQDAYVKRSTNKGKWEQPWILNLFKVIIIFVGLILIISAYPAVFGPIHLNF